MKPREFRSLLRLLRPYPWVVPTLVVTGMVASLADGLTIGMLVPLIALVVFGDAAPPATGVLALLHRYADLLPVDYRVVLLGLTMVGLVLARALVVSGNMALSAWISGQVGHAMRGAVLRQLLDVSYGFLARVDRGLLLNTLATGTWRAADAVAIVISIVSHACTVAVFMVLLVLISWPLTLGVLVGVPVAVAIAGRLRQPARRLGALSHEAQRTLAERYVEVLDGMRIVRAFGQEAREEHRLREASDRVRIGNFWTAFLMGLVAPISEVLLVPLFLGTLLLAWYLGVGMPTLLAYLIMLHRMHPHLRSLDAKRVHLAGLAAAVDEVLRLLDRHDKPYTESGREPFAGLQRQVTFRDVTFGYDDTTPDGPPAVRGCSFEIRRGEVTAIVGCSGAGKSTLINLLYRFYDPRHGEILVDGRPLTRLVLSDWRRRIALAGQDAELMSGSVLDNIVYGAPSSPRWAVVEAARQADADGFIEALPDGYDTRVGERGLRLSGGQRQRIGLARALLRKPDILILDEATNAVDSLSEWVIQEMLDRLRGSTTIIVIAHRWSTIRNAGRVVVMEEGRVVETGRPEELVDAGGPFAQLYGVPSARRE